MTRDQAVDRLVAIAAGLEAIAPQMPYLDVAAKVRGDAEAVLALALDLERYQDAYFRLAAEKWVGEPVRETVA